MKHSHELRDACSATVADQATLPSLLSLIWDTIGAPLALHL